MNIIIINVVIFFDDLTCVLAFLACADGCVVAVWVTNSRAVQSFVEDGLFRRWSCSPLARWYWLKLAPNGAWAVPGAAPRSPHRKPWEVCLLGSCAAASDDEIALEVRRSFRADLRQ